MQIAFFGSSLVSAYWNGAATYYRGIIRALYDRGHRVTFYEPDAWQRQQHRDIADPEWAQVVVYDNDRDAVLRAVSKAAGADLIVKASGVGVFDELLEEAVLDLRTSTNIIGFWDVDAPATLDRLFHNPADPLIELIPRYDVVLTYGGGDPVENAYRALGSRQCVPVYNALDPRTHFPVPPDKRFRADLAFLGNRLPDREARVEEFFLEPASRLPELVFLLGGSGWGDKARSSNIRYLDHVYTADHNALNCSSRVVLNVTRESMARYGFSPATRVFEAAGAAACLVTDAWEGVDRFFEPSSEILVATTGNDVVEYLGSVTIADARKIGEAAYRRVLAEHTYDRRAEQIDALLDMSPVEFAGAIQ
jgi:spore maturation protein CgeB